MKSIGGNVMASFLRLKVTRNRIGEMERSYEKIAEHIGFLDYSSGSSSYRTFSTKTEESSHVFLCDRFDVDRSQVTRLMIGEKYYDVLSFDEPMGLGYHFEIYLKETVQNGG